METPSPGWRRSAKETPRTNVLCHCSKKRGAKGIPGISRHVALRELFSSQHTLGAEWEWEHRPFPNRAGREKLTLVGHFRGESEDATRPGFS